MKKKMQYLAVYFSTINMVFYGMTFGWPSPSLPKLLASDSPIKITHDEGSWLSVIPMAGVFVGDPVFAHLANVFGRKNILLSLSLPFIASGIIIGFCESFVYLMLARFMAGLGGAGLFTVVPTYIAEVAESKVRGQLGAMLVWMFDFGVLLIYVVGPFISIKHMAFLTICIPIISLFCVVWIPESPYFYMLHRNREEATNILKKLREEDDVDDIINEIEEHLSLTTSFFDIFRYPINRKSICIILILVTVKESSGWTPFLFYSPQIIKDADDSIPADYVSICYGCIMFISSFCGSLIVDKFRRKTLLIFSCTGATCCLLIEGSYFFVKYYLKYNTESVKWLPVIVLILFPCTYQVGLRIVPMTIAVEIFATNVKTNGLCILDLYTATIATCMAKFFEFTLNNIGSYVSFWTFAGLLMLGIVFIIKYVPETRGLTLEEIQFKLRKHAAKNKM